MKIPKSQHFIVLPVNKIIESIFRILIPKEKKDLYILVLLNAIMSVIDILFIAALVFIVAFYAEGLHVFNTNFLPSWFLGKGSLYLFMIFLLFLVFKNWMAMWISQFQFQFVFKVALRISKENLERYLESDYKEYIKTDSSVYIRKIINQPIEFSQYILAGFQQLVTEIILVIITIGAVAFYKASLFLILFIILFPLILLVSYLVKRKLKLVRSHIKDSSERSLQYLRETLMGFIEVNIYNSKRFFIERFYKEQEILCKYLPDLQVSQNMSAKLMELFAISGLFLLFLANQYLGNNQTGTILNIGAFVAAAYKIIPGIIKILNLRDQLKTFGFTTIDMAIVTNPALENLEPVDESIKSITFSDVAYSYKDKMILDKCTINIQSGDFVGISGPSGIGKTTFINLLLGFLKEEKGQILINHKYVNSNDRQKHWNKISYVKQQNFLIHDTLQNNICFDDQLIDVEKYNCALHFSGLDDFVKATPEGDKKIITENGKNISGGQRQRIAIARALYKKADLYILDEPFNELDEHSETILLEYFKKLTKQGSMVILITHNTNNLSYCDKVLSLFA